MLERDGELARIHELIDGARLGSGRLLLIEAPAGIGKTRLIDEACHAGEAAGMQVLRARGVALERTFAFGVVRQLFERVLADASREERRALLAGAASIGGALLGFTIREAPRPVADATFASFHGLYWLCFNLAGNRPLLIAVDDAHLADAPSLRFVSFLTARLEGLPAAVLLALRPGERHSGDGLLELIGTDPVNEVLRPSELSERACEQLIGGLFEAPPEATFCRACFEATGGNPFYLRALVDGLRDEKVTFFDVGPQGAREIGAVNGGTTGALTFTPAPGSATHFVEAEVEMAGLPVPMLGGGSSGSLDASTASAARPGAAMVTVARFHPPRLVHAGPVRHLRLQRRGTVLRVSWRGSHGALRYAVTVRLRNGRLHTVIVRRTTASITGIPRTEAGQITIAAIGNDGRAGPALRAGFRATAKPRTILRPLGRR
jgi:hypothetical protein